MTDHTEIPGVGSKPDPTLLSVVSPDHRGLSEYLNDLESPEEELRLQAIGGLKNFPGLTIVRAVKRVACTDPSPTVRSQARYLLEALNTSQTDIPVGKKNKNRGSRRIKSLLSNSDPSIRVKVVKYLGMNQDPMLPVLLAKSLRKEKDPWVICAMVRALATTGGSASADHVSHFLDHPDPRVRATAIEALESIGDRGVLVRLMPLLSDPHHRVRASAIRAVRAQDREAVLTCIDSMLADSEDLMIRSALYVLRFFSDEEALDRIRRVLAKDPSPSWFRMAMRSLGFMAKRGSVRAAQLMALERDRSVHGKESINSITSGLMGLGESPIQARLEDRLDSELVDERIGGLREISRQGRLDLVSKIRALFARESDPRVLATIVTIMGRLGGPEDAKSILSHLRSSDARLRANVVEAIGLLAPKEAADHLRESLTDENNRVRANAIVALGGSTLDILPVLKKMAGSDSEAHAISAVWAASTLATDPTVEILGGMLGHPSDRVKSSARDALKALAPVLNLASRLLSGEHRPKLPPKAASVSNDQIQRLTFDLCHDTASVRLETVKKIVALKNPAFIAPVKELLRDQDPSVRHSAREALREILRALTPPVINQEVLEGFVAQLDSGAQVARGALTEVLELARECGPRPIAEALCSRLPVEEDPYLRANLLSALALVGDESAVDLILAFINDPDARVRANAVDALDLLGSDEDLKAVIPCLADPDPRVRAAAITAAMGVYKQPFLDHLKGMLRSESVTERAAGLYALSTVMIEERFTILHDFYLSESQPQLYENAGDLLAREMVMHADFDVSVFVRRITSENKRHQFEACYRRWSDSDSSHRPAPRQPSTLESSDELSGLMDKKHAGKLDGDTIRRALADQTDPLTLTFLLETAGEIQLEDAVDLAQPFSRSKDRRIRLAAVEALGRIGSEDALESLAALARDRDDEISAQALELLERIRPRSARVAIQSLIDTRQNWAIRRGLDLIEVRQDPDLLPIVLSLIEKGSNPVIVESVSRILTLMASEEVLEKLGTLHERARASSRPFIQTLGMAVGSALGMTEAQLKPRFSAKTPAMSASSPEMARSSASVGNGTLVDAPVSFQTPEFAQTVLEMGTRLSGHLDEAMDNAPRWRRPVAMGGVAVFVFGVFIIGISGDREPVQTLDRTPRPTRKVERVARRFSFEDSKKEIVFTQSSSGSSRPSVQDYNWEPTFEEVKRSLAIAFSAKGITSDTVLEVMTFERTDLEYRYAIAQGRAKADEGEYRSALSSMRAVLENMPEKHLSGRIALIRMMIKLAREGQLWEEIDELKVLLAQARGQMLALLEEAALEGGLPGHMVEEILQQIADQKEAGQKTITVGEWLSGRDTSDPSI